MKIQVHGISLHCYDRQKNSDKFYRVYIWQDSTGLWYLNKCWGRDGSMGAYKSYLVRYQAVGEIEMHAIQAAQVGKGYEFLGETKLLVEAEDLTDDPRGVGAKLHDWIGREPVKLPDGYIFIIREEEDILDLIA